MRAAVTAALLLLTLTAAGPLAAQTNQVNSPRLGDERVLLRTNRGDLVIALYPDLAPGHVAQILKLVRLGVYDSTRFFRVDPRFVVQLSNAQNRRFPLSPEQQAAIRKLPAEFSSIRHRPGIVSMAREDGDVNSAETSFSLLLVPAPHLDGKYTVIGEIEWGSAVLMALATAPRDAQNRPLKELLVEKALVKTGAEITAMRTAGELQQVVPLPVGDLVRAGLSSEPADRTMAGGLLLMMVLSLCGFVLAGRLPPHRVGAFSLLTVLTGAFFLFRETIPTARSNAWLASGIFFGFVGLFKLMNRFEGARPAPAPAPAAPRPSGATGPDGAERPAGSAV
jgi:cyclophilin family peptidyl-prolyl cis-trans isomerase